MSCFVSPKLIKLIFLFSEQFACGTLEIKCLEINVAETFILSNMCVLVYLESNQVCKRCVYMSEVRA